jgi:hypothetical protein
VDLERERSDLAEALCAWMDAGIPGAPPDEGRFDALARRIFAYQFATNAPYRRFCERRGVRPADVRTWRDVPAVATDAFKEVPLTCFPPERAAAVFVTSGTTRGGERRGHHYLRTLALYHAALLPAFAAYVLPDGARLPAVVLGFSPRAMPQSSLSHMFGVVVERLCAPAPPGAEGPRGDGVTYFLGPEGIDLAGAIARLEALAAAGRPVLVMGTAFAFVHLLDALVARGRRLLLPPGSRIMDTGGYKGRSREVPKDELYGLYTEVLGVPASHIVNEYGMTEMSSQCYDGVLRDRYAAAPAHGETAAPSAAPPPEGGGTTRGAVPDVSPLPRHGAAGLRGERWKQSPPWVRTQVVDPETLAPLPHGQTGLLRHYDLANLDSVMALQTADLGVAGPGGFEIIGRAAGAEARGCSLAVEELLRAQRE